METIPCWAEIEHDLLRNARPLVAVLRMSDIDYTADRVIIRCQDGFFREWLLRPKLRTALEESLRRHLGADIKLTIKK
jgi:hypothetical protein